MNDRALDCRADAGRWESCVGPVSLFHWGDHAWYKCLGPLQAELLQNVPTVSPLFLSVL